MKRIYAVAIAIPIVATLSAWGYVASAMYNDWKFTQEEAEAKAAMLPEARPIEAPVVILESTLEPIVVTARRIKSKEQRVLVDNHKAEIEKFAIKMERDHQFNRQEVIDLLTKIKPNQDVIKLYSRPYTAKPITEWEIQQINERRIVNGVVFYKENQQALDRAEQQFGVPATVIAALIGVETSYGNFLGGFKVIESLTTLGFYGPRRREYFQTELEHFLVYGRELNWNYDEIVGSYAGAIGIPQFMPSNIKKLAIDFDGDNHIDLVHNKTDAIGSVANFLAQSGWQRDRPVATITAMKPKRANTIVLRTLPGPQPVHWLCHKNFDVIKAYNPSDSYAMTIFILSEKIKQRLAA